MRKSRFPLDDATFEVLRRRALEKRASVASVGRDALAGSAGRAQPPAPTLADFGFIGAGSGEPPPGGPVSVRHHEFLDEAIGARFPTR